MLSSQGSLMSTGVGVLSLTHQATVPAAVIPLPVPSHEDIASPRFSAASPSATLEYLFASSSELTKLTYRQGNLCIAAIIFGGAGLQRPAPLDGGTKPWIQSI